MPNYVLEARIYVSEHETEFPSLPRYDRVGREIKPRRRPFANSTNRERTYLINPSFNWRRTMNRDGRGAPAYFTEPEVFTNFRRFAEYVRDEKNLDPGFTEHDVMRWMTEADAMSDTEYHRRYVANYGRWLYEKMDRRASADYSAKTGYPPEERDFNYLRSLMYE